MGFPVYYKNKYPYHSKKPLFYWKSTFFLKRCDASNRHLGLGRRSGHRFAAWLTQRALADSSVELQHGGRCGEGGLGGHEMTKPWGGGGAQEREVKGGVTGYLHLHALDQLRGLPPPRMVEDSAMPQHAPASWFGVFSLLASGVTAPRFLAPDGT